MFEGLELPEDYDIMSVQEGDPQSDAIYSLSENKESINFQGIPQEFINVFREEDRTYWIGRTGGYRPLIRVSELQHNCQHKWKYNSEVEQQILKCHTCGSLSDLLQVQTTCSFL